MRDQFQNLIDRIAHVEANIGCHLVVTGTARVQTLTRVANQFSQAFFNIEMDVFQVEQPSKLTALDFCADLCHATLNVGIVLGADDVLCL